MVSVASQLIQEVTAHVQSDSLGDAREICADSTYFLNNIRNKVACDMSTLCISMQLLELRQNQNLYILNYLKPGN